jgi:catechol 2,3-dioxygenase-like lactoylglutathione lyase family enzyme
MLAGSLAVGVRAAEEPLRPVLVGIYTQSYEETIKWYVENLGFEVENEFENEPGNIRLSFLDNGEFELEIYSDLVPAEATDRISRDRFGMPTEGFVKLSLEADSLAPLESKLKANGVNFVRETNESDRKPGASWFMISDPDGNLIQVFGPTP